MECATPCAFTSVTFFVNAICILKNEERDVISYVMEVENSRLSLFFTLKFCILRLRPYLYLLPRLIVALFMKYMCSKQSV
jgi:hypothetical protein